MTECKFKRFSVLLRLQQNLLHLKTHLFAIIKYNKTNELLSKAMNTTKKKKKTIIICIYVHFCEQKIDKAINIVCKE
jgi:hypothetical protein